MENVYYLTDSFMRWLSNRDRGLYDKLLQQAEFAEARRYGDPVSFERGVALRFADESASQNFGAILHKATLLWVNEENRLGFPEIPQRTQNGESIFISDNFIRWIQKNRIDLLEKMESYLIDKNIEKESFGTKDSPLGTGHYLIFSRAEDMELVGTILQKAVLDALKYTIDSYGNTNLSV